MSSKQSRRSAEDPPRCGREFRVTGIAWRTAVQQSRVVGKPQEPPPSCPSLPPPVRGVFSDLVFGCRDTAQFSAQHRHARRDQTRAAQMRPALVLRPAHRRALAQFGADSVRQSSPDDPGWRECSRMRGPNRTRPRWNSAHAAVSVPALWVAAVTPCAVRSARGSRIRVRLGAEPSRRGAPFMGCVYPVVYKK